MRTYLRPDLPRYKSWRESLTGKGQWDRITGVLHGRWESLAAARATLAGKWLNFGLGFFADGDNVDANYVEGGMIDVSFSAAGLFDDKYKDLEGSAEDQRSLTNVSHPFPTAIIPSPTGPDVTLEFKEIKRTLDIVCCMPASLMASDWRNQGKPLAGNTHPIAVAAGRPTLPDTGTNPFTSGDFTYHYPYGWYYQIIPQDSLGTGNRRLVIVTYRFIHGWPKTL